jgi:hypothetical protein
MSKSGTFKIEITLEHLVDDSGLDAQPELLIAAIERKLEEYKANPAKMRKELFAAGVKLEDEDAWILRDAQNVNRVWRNGQKSLPLSRYELTKEDILTSNDARAMPPSDGKAIYVRIEDLDINLVIAEFHDASGQVRGAVDLRRWINNSDTDRELLQFFAENPMDPICVEDIMTFYKFERHPSAMCLWGPEELTLVIKDPDYAVDMACDLRSVTSDYGLKP